MDNSAVDTVNRLMNSINSGDVESALKQYEENAVFVAEVGNVITGKDSISVALNELVSVKPRIETISHELLISGDVALYSAKWKMSGIGPDGCAFVQEGISADVLKRNSDNEWLISIDNPYGQEILG